MISRRNLLISGAIACSSPSLFAAQTYTAGKEYLVVNPPAPTINNKIEVVEFFAYTCPHCLRFYPVFHEWSQHVPSDVVVTLCPVAWNKTYEPFSRTFYALKALNKFDDLNLPFFESVIYQTQKYEAATLVDDIASFMVNHGVDRNQWLQTFNSFGVMGKAQQADNLWKSYQIDSTPMIGVGGLYSTGPHLVGSRERTPECIDYLINEVRKTR